MTTPIKHTTGEFYQVNGPEPSKLDFDTDDWPKSESSIRKYESIEHSSDMEDHPLRMDKDGNVYHICERCKEVTANYVHACQKCDKCDGCALECEHAPKFTTTTSSDSSGEHPVTESFMPQPNMEHGSDDEYGYSGFIFDGAKKVESKDNGFLIELNKYIADEDMPAIVDLIKQRDTTRDKAMHANCIPKDSVRAIPVENIPHRQAEPTKYREENTNG